MSSAKELQIKKDKLKSSRHEQNKKLDVIERDLKAARKLDVPKGSRDELHKLVNSIRHSKHNKQARIKAINKRIEVVTGKIHHQQHANGPEAVKEWADAMAGHVTESPAGSNMGPYITDWERRTGYNPPPGVYWCGCACHEGIVEIGGAFCDSDILYGYGPSLINAARAGQHGIKAVPLSEIRLGDGLVFWGGEHIGIARGSYGSGGLPTWEGNTSAADGSQNNGGGFYAKTRYAGDVTVAFRPSY